MSVSLAERLRRLASYGTIFASPGFTFGHWVEPTPDENGVMHMPWYEYSDAAEAFAEEAYALGWVLDFDWMKWGRRRPRGVASWPILVSSLAPPPPTSPGC